MTEDELSLLRARLSVLEAENARLRKGTFEPSVPTVVRVPEDVRALFEHVAGTMREQIFGKIDIDPSRAMIDIGDERYLLVRASAFSIDLVDTLVQLYADRGEAEALAIARGFLFDIAHTFGIHDAKKIHEKLGSRDPMEKLTGGPILFAYTGWAMVELRPGSNPVPNEDYCLVYEHTYSFEAAAFLRAGRRTSGPACIMNSGYSSGWCEESFGLELTALEVKCRARGDDGCFFVMAPPHRLAERAKEHYGIDVKELQDQGFDVPTYFERKRAEEEVRRSLDHLKKAQDELVRKERLATVGLLVSGVAHEVNTPLGVAVTANSTLAEELAAVKKKFEANALTKGDLRAYFERATQAESLVRMNLDRAAREILKFKRVSVDQATQETRSSDLGAYVKETLDSLRPIARKAKLEVRFTAVGNLECTTSPGAVAQVVTNFITNSGMHAKKNDGSAVNVEVKIAREEGRRVVLTYTDDGAGMSDEVKEQAFKPFFTTQRGAGGSGLGLHIVQSLVVDLLRGKIDVTSAPGKGTKFVVSFEVDPPTLDRV